MAAERLAPLALALAAVRPRGTANLDDLLGGLTEGRDAAGAWIDRAAAVSGRLRPVPDGPARAALAEDRAGMIANGMLLGEGEPFESLMESCAALEERTDRPRANGGPV